METKPTKSIYELLQEVRYELFKSNLRKSGVNRHLNFNYFELKDFIPAVTVMFYERGMTPIFNIEIVDGIEWAVLDIVKGSETITFKSPTADTGQNNPIQNLGSKITYMRRYLYLMALDLAENDTVDAEDRDTTKYATKVQIEKIFSNGKLIADLLSEMGIKTKNDLTGITMEKASELCTEIERRKTDA